MVQAFELLGIGLVMGVFGGLLGLGGSVIMIPAMVMVFSIYNSMYNRGLESCPEKIRCDAGTCFDCALKAVQYPDMWVALISSKNW